MTWPDSSFTAIHARPGVRNKEADSYAVIEQTLRAPLSTALAAVTPVNDDALFRGCYLRACYVFHHLLPPNALLCSTQRYDPGASIYAAGFSLILYKNSSMRYTMELHESATCISPSCVAAAVPMRSAQCVDFTGSSQEVRIYTQAVGVFESSTARDG